MLELVNKSTYSKHLCFRMLKTFRNFIVWHLKTQNQELYYANLSMPFSLEERKLF